MILHVQLMWDGKRGIFGFWTLRPLFHVPSSRFLPLENMPQFYGFLNDCVLIMNSQRMIGYPE